MSKEIMTSEYSLFKILPENRKICEAHVKNLMESISGNNLLEFNPIMVDEKMNVIDGQHRLEACKRLRIPIWYKIEKDLTSSDMISLNQVKKGWGLQDFLHYYCEKGNKNYIKLRDFIARTGCSLYTVRQKIGHWEDYRIKFKTGKFVYNENLFENNYKFMKEASILCEFMYDKNILPSYKKGYLKTSTFVSALADLLERGMDAEIFKQKYLMNRDLITPCRNKEVACKMFVEIYNFKNRNPFNVSDSI